MKKRYCYLFIIFGIILLWIVISHIAHYTPHDYFYKNHPDVRKYIGTNIVTRWADLSYFTYHTMIFSGIWLIMVGVSVLFNLNCLKKFARNQSVMTFVMTNYVLTIVLYTIFEFATGNPTFGWYGFVNKSIHNFGTNILAHYVCFGFVFFTYLKTKPITPFKKIHLLYIFGYLLSYFIIVKVLGMYAYKIVWYPYPIFDEIYVMRFFGLRNYYLGLVAFVFVLFLIFIGYFSVFLLFIKKKKVCNDTNA